MGKSQVDRILDAFPEEELKEFAMWIHIPGYTGLDVEEIKEQIKIYYPGMNSLYHELEILGFISRWDEPMSLFVVDEDHSLEPLSQTSQGVMDALSIEAGRTMVTTVQVQPSTRDKLLLVRAQLELQTGRRHTLDDAIRWLIEKVNAPPKEDRIRMAESTFGSIKDLGITTEDLKELRKQAISRVAQF